MNTKGESLLEKAKKQRAEVLAQDIPKEEPEVEMEVETEDIHDFYNDTVDETLEDWKFDKKIHGDLEVDPIQPKITPKEETYEIEIVDNTEKPMSLASAENHILTHLKLYNFVKRNIVNESDFANIKGKKSLKKSGYRKFINAFKLTIELIDEKVYELMNDWHCEVRVRAITPEGQSVEGLGIKSMSELYEKTLHNLKTNAWTRAVNRAVSDLVAFGEVSAEELKNTPKDEVDWTE